MLEPHKRGSNKQSQNKIKDGGSGREVRGEGEWGNRAILRKSGSMLGSNRKQAHPCPRTQYLETRAWVDRKEKGVVKDRNLRVKPQ